ncbi:Z-ring formation inhibitor MciZ [Anaerobacterium chartisolvens]|nr:Z-ring formation inhibitor MciZ [Anaerobacterium chartisolvens]
MKQLVYPDKLFIAGKAWEVKRQLNHLSASFRTIKEVLDFYTRTPGS